MMNRFLDLIIVLLKIIKFFMRFGDVYIRLNTTLFFDAENRGYKKIMGSTRFYIRPCMADN